MAEAEDTSIKSVREAKKAFFRMEKPEIGSLLKVKQLFGSSRTEAITQL
jgi:hypothetical protein